MASFLHLEIDCKFYRDNWMSRWVKIKPVIKTGFILVSLSNLVT